MVTRIRAGERPSHPKDPSQNRWLQHRVWGVISTGWSHEPEERCGLSDMHHVFSTFPQWEQGDLNTPNAGELQTARQVLGKKISSFFQFLRDTEPEIQKRVNEMNQVSFTTSPQG